MQKITPFLWFNNDAEEAINYYSSVFPDARIGHIARYPPGGPAPEGTLLTASFFLNGQEFIALNGGPQYRFTEAVSFVINCSTQEEIDHYWDKLSEGGEKSRCGWLKDRWGLSWQVVPKQLGELMSDPKKAGPVMQAMMGMDKLDIAGLEAAGNRS